MKKFYLPFLLFALSFVVVSCSHADEDFSEAGKLPSSEVQGGIFAEPDGSKELTGTQNNKVKNLLEAIGTDFAKGLGLGFGIEEWQLTEIKTFTDKLVTGCDTDYKKFLTIYNYVGDEIKYESYNYVDNDPYPVFANKKAVCQGYSNLLKVMCYTQNIPAIVVRGNLFYNNIFYGAHAWNYVYADGEWHVCDPTNKSTVGGGPYAMSSTSYNNTLKVLSIDAVIFEDENFTYTYNDEHLNVHTVKSNNSQVVVPYSVCGYKLTSFNPTATFPTTVEELVIGSNIQTLGRQDYIVGINHYANNVSSIQIDPENEYFESYENVVYEKSGSSYKLISIAPATKKVELKPITYFDKECAIKDHKNLEVIIFSPGTEVIDAYSVENCPNLHTAYVPTDTEVSADAFYDVAANFQIIRGDYTGIPQIKED